MAIKSGLPFAQMYTPRHNNIEKNENSRNNIENVQQWKMVSSLSYIHVYSPKLGVKPISQILILTDIYIH